MTTPRRTPSGQGPSRRPASRTRQTGAVRQSPTRAGTTRQTGGINTGQSRSGQSRSGQSRSQAAKSQTGNRPSVTRRTVNVSTGPTKRTVAKRPQGLTSRATVLIVVFVALALAYTYPLRTYLAQKSQIAQLEADQAAQRKVITEKQQELAKWDDPEYVRTQARKDLFYVRPGETPLIIFSDPDGVDRDQGKNVSTAAPGPWYDTLWGSVRAADAEQPNAEQPN
jgi:cell division protein FtsB